MGSMSLTAKQKALLLFITARIRSSGVAPSFEEMKHHLGLNSKSGVHRLVTALEARGHIQRLHNHARAISLCEDPLPGSPDDHFASSIMRTAEMATLGSISKSEALRRIYAKAKEARTYV